MARHDDPLEATRQRLRRVLTDQRHAPAVAVAVLLLVAGTSLAWYGYTAVTHDPTDAVAAAHDHDHADHGHDDHVRYAHLDHTHVHRSGLPGVPCPSGAEVPRDGDLASLTYLPGTRIHTDDGFTPAAGVTAGRGTPADPYVIEGIRTPLLQLSDTTAYFVVAGSDIGTLVLDWNGKGGLVCKNHIGDLRVNRNVERVEAPTAGLIVDNEIDEVGQIRHFDGLFARNVVGTPTSRGVVLNVDGMNGGEIMDNVVHGGVDVKLHGHHHGVPGASHMHTEAADNASTYEVDHTFRPHLLIVRNNTIVDPSGFGLRYNDRNHAGDDRTAASEESPTLELPHVHRTTVVIEGNEVRHAPLRVEILNAKDELHEPGEHARLFVLDNVVRDVATGSGILVSAVRNAEVHIEGNKVSRVEVADLLTPVGLGTGAGVDVAHVENATLTIRDTLTRGFTYGVRGQDFDGNTTWAVVATIAEGARHDVYWDQSVANEPRRS